MALIFTSTAYQPRPNGVDIAAPPGGPPEGGWDVSQALMVMADTDAYNVRCLYEVEEAEVEATAGGSLEHLAGKPHHPPGAMTLPTVDLVGAGDRYPWEGDGYVQWEIPYQIRRVADRVLVEEGTVIQRIQVTGGVVTVTKGNFTVTFNANPLPIQRRDE